MAGRSSASAGERSPSTASAVISRRMRWMMSSIRTATTYPLTPRPRAAASASRARRTSRCLVYQVDVDPVAARAGHLELVLDAGALSRMDVARDQRAQRLAEGALGRNQPATDHDRAAPRRR